MKLLTPTFVIAILLLGFAGCNLSATPPPLLIGHVSDKTRIDKGGDQAELGIRLALAEPNKESPLADEFAGRPIQVRHTDAHGSIEAFESEAVRLDSVNKCLALLGGLSTQETSALSHAKIPLVTFQGQPAPGAGNQVFYLGMAPSRQGAVLAKIAAEKGAPDLDIVMVMDERRPESAILAESFEKTLTDERKRKDEKPPTFLILRCGKNGKWKETIERISSQKPRYVVYVGGVQDFNAWYSPFREVIDRDTELLYAGNDGDHRQFDLGADVKHPIVLATAFYADPASEKITNFMKAYKDAFGKDANVHSALAYDGCRMLVAAMKRTATQLTPDKLREELAKDYDGLTGPLTFTSDRQAQRPIYVVSWNDGALKLVKKFDVEKAQ